MRGWPRRSRGVNYGMGVPALARGLDRHPLIASTIIEHHKRTYPRFWQWRAGQVQAAMLTRRIESTFGWPLRLTTSPLAAWRLCEAGIVPVMLIHDGILLEVTDREQIELAQDIMRRAGRDVCDGFEIGVDVDQMLAGGTRYSDKRPMAKKMWGTIMGALQNIGAMPRRASA
jgi:DNA polymerase I